MQRVQVSVPGALTSVLDAGQGRPTLFIHGTSSSAEMGWAPYFGRLAAKRRCLAFDMAGSGETQDDGQALSLELMVSQAVATAGLAPDEPIDIVGYSLGAVVAAAAAAAMPERVRRLVLLGGWVKADSRMKLQFDLWTALSQTDRLQLARLLLINGVSAEFFAAAPPEAIEAAVTRFPPLLANGGDRQAQLDATLDLTAHLPKIKADTLAIGLKQDRLVPPEHVKQLADGIAGAKHVEMNTGHLVFLEQADALLDLIEQHLDRP